MCEAATLNYVLGRIFDRGPLDHDYLPSIDPDLQCWTGVDVRLSPESQRTAFQARGYEEMPATVEIMRRMVEAAEGRFATALRVDELSGQQTHYPMTHERGPCDLTECDHPDWQGEDNGDDDFVLPGELGPDDSSDARF